MNPSASVGFAGDVGRASDGAGGRAAGGGAAPRPAWRSAASVENAEAAGQNAAISTSGATLRNDLFMRSLMAS